MNQPLTLEEQKATEQKRVEKLEAKEQKRLDRELKKIKNKADYVAVPSSYGPFIKVQKINVTFGNDQATALIEKNLAKDITAKQSVILYDKEDKNMAMPLGGVVKYTNNENGKSKIIIDLPRGTNTEFLSDIVGVITLQTINSQRLPLSALTKNKDNESIVWLARQNDDKKFKIEHHKIDKAQDNGKFFTPKQHTIGPYDLIITNPDKFIRTDQDYQVFVTKMDTPTLNPIDQARVDFDVYLFESRQAQLIQSAEDCANGRPKDGLTSLPDGSTSTASACGATTNENDIMFQIFQSLTTPNNGTEGNGVNQGACGQVSASCGQ